MRGIKLQAVKLSSNKPGVGGSKDWFLNLILKLKTHKKRHYLGVNYFAVYLKDAIFVP